jgi:hypothetical protein
VLSSKSRSCASADADADAETAADGLGGRDDGATCAGALDPKFCAIGTGPRRGKKPGGGGGMLLNSPAGAGVYPPGGGPKPWGGGGKPEVGVGRRHRAGLLQSLVAVAKVAEESPEAVGRRVRLGNLEVVGQLPCLQGNQVALAVPVEADGVVRVLHDRHISGYLTAIGCKAYVCFLGEDPPAWDYGNVIVCVFFLLFFGCARGGASDGNIVVGVLCVDTISYSRVYLLLPQLNHLPGLHPSTTAHLLVVAGNKNKFALLQVLFNVLLLYDIVELCFEVFELLLVHVRE